MNLSFLKRSFVNPDNKKVCEEYFPRYNNPSYIGAGEIMTRFIKINTDLQENIEEFFEFCEMDWDTKLLKRIKEEQKYVKEFIKQYNNIPILYNKETASIICSSDIKKREALLLKQLNNPDYFTLSKILSKKTANIKIEFEPIYESKPIVFIRNGKLIDSKIDKAQNLQRIDIIPSYKCEDIFSIVWIEIAHLIMNKRKLCQCHCGTYFVKIGSRKSCGFCGSPPSRMPAAKQKEIYPKEYTKGCFKDRIKRYIKRNASNPKVVLKKLHIEMNLLKNDKYMKSMTDLKEWLIELIKEWENR